MGNICLSFCDTQIFFHYNIIVVIIIHPGIITLVTQSQTLCHQICISITRKWVGTKPVERGGCVKCFGTPGFLSENTKYLQVRFTGVHFWLEWCLGCFDMFLPFPENLPFSPAAVQQCRILKYYCRNISEPNSFFLYPETKPT